MSSIGALSPSSRPGVITSIRPRVTGRPESVAVEVDLGAILANASDVQRRVGPDVGLLAVLKADAYGHGLVPVARALDGEGAVAGFVVTSVRDAFALANEGVDAPIVCLAPTFGGEHEAVLAAGIVPVVTSTGDLVRFGHVARRLGGTHAVHAKVDTGMARLGIREAEIDDFLAIAAAAPELVVTGMCTHLSSADERDPSVTDRQLDAFQRARARFRRAGHRPTMIHASNTAAAFRHPQTHFRHVRTGISLFGGDEPSGAVLRPALRFWGRVVQLRTIDAGDPVSYGERWRASRPTRIATVPIGYAHGYPRRPVGRAEALLHGRRVPVVGTICMEMLMLDVTELGDRVGVGDEVVLVGSQGAETIRATELADRTGGIVEEIFCGLSSTVPRLYVRAGERTAPEGVHADVRRVG